MKPLVSHNRIYCIVLTIFIPLTLFNAVALFYWWLTVGEPIGHLQRVGCPMGGGANVVYAVSMCATLVARTWRPGLGRKLTFALNLALLPAFLCGTILGIYGLWKVDRQHQALKRNFPA